MTQGSTLPATYSKSSRRAEPSAGELVRVLENNRRALVGVFASALASMPRWERAIEGAQSHWDQFLQQQFFSYVDYLCEYFRSGDATYRQLFIGEKIKSLYDANLDDEASRRQMVLVNQAERDGLERVLRSRLSAEDWHSFVICRRIFRARLAPWRAIAGRRRVAAGVVVLGSAGDAPGQATAK